MEIPVNLKNPAQFFAAAGIAQLLEVPSRFEVEEYEGEPLPRSMFVLPDVDLQTMLRDLKAATYEERVEADGTTYSYDDNYSRPVLITLPDKTIELDWWLNEFWSEKSALKTWAGTSTPISMLRRLAEMMDSGAADILNFGLVASGSSRPRWGFDPRVTKNTGVAGRLAKVKVYPVTELLCAVGLQYFRPLITSEDITFYVWRDELPVELAIATGELDGVRTLRLSARREKRSKGTFKYTAAEFVANRAPFRATRRFANKGGRQGGRPPGKYAHSGSVSLS